jgi:hypothetical protein
LDPQETPQDTRDYASETTMASVTHDYVITHGEIPTHHCHDFLLFWFSVVLILMYLDTDLKKDSKTSEHVFKMDLPTHDPSQSRTDISGSSDIRTIENASWPTPYSEHRSGGNAN